MRWIGKPEHQESIDVRDSMYPSAMTSVRTDLELGTETGTIFGYIHSGEWEVRNSAFSSIARGQGFFSAAGGVGLRLKSKDGLVICIERCGYKGLNLMGQRETRGRMSYIDGCSDSLLVFPNRMGDACLNHLHFPKGILQTQHTHPSIRLGFVAGGEGWAWYEGAYGKHVDAKSGKVQTFSEPWEIKLAEGGMFLLEESEQHSFKTLDKTMDVIAYHPDTDWGPTDFNHPMLNRTYIDHGKK